MRPSLSLAGTMVLSVVVDGVVKHMALDGNQLDTRSLEARTPPQLRFVLASVPNASPHAASDARVVL